jgi:hypothetical protein
MADSYLIKWETKTTIRYWTGKEWNRHDAKGYISFKNAQRVIQRKGINYPDVTIIKHTY